MAHIHELIDLTAGVYVVNKDKVLIRQHEKYGFWLHVGGHVELNEHPSEAAIRECFEEVGLKVVIPNDNTTRAVDMPAYDGSGDVQVLPLPKRMNIHRINETHQHLDLIYFATSETDTVIPENPDDKWVWLTAEEVESHSEMNPQMKEYALGALKELAW